MADLPDTEDESDPEPTTVTSGYFEEEFRVDAASAGEFLAELGDQLQDGTELTVSGDGWEIPFAFADSVEIEVEFEGESDPELEVEVELTGRTEDDAPDVA
ncbi:MAG: amphi-Trp domain-containing protein [Haloferacaceae archaeon]